MSRPRKPFGSERPGRLAATMVRVLAAEMSDPGRLSRGKRYWTDDAVVDLVVGHGAVTAEVQGSRAQPYVVTLEARPGRQAPSRSEVSVRCTCPDDDGTGRWACKHAVAALFALSDEISVDPDVVARWRRTDTLDDGDTPDDRDTDDRNTARAKADTRDQTAALAAGGRSKGAAAPRVDPLDELLRFPPTRALPEIPALADATLPRLPDRLVAGVLDDAADHLRIRWH